MKRSTTIILSVLAFLNLVTALPSLFEESDLSDAVFARQAACGSFPCSGNATCLDFGCGYCKSDYCVAKAVVASMSSAPPKSSSAAPESTKPASTASKAAPMSTSAPASDMRSSASSMMSKATTTAGGGAVPVGGGASHSSSGTDMSATGTMTASSAAMVTMQEMGSGNGVPFAAGPTGMSASSASGVGMMMDASTTLPSYYMPTGSGVYASSLMPYNPDNVAPQVTAAGGAMVAALAVAGLLL